MSCSLIEPSYERISLKMPCIIYAHDNTGNKLDGMDYAELLLPLGINFCTFDFSGCGNSNGKYVTMGHNEKNDLKSVI